MGLEHRRAAQEPGTARSASISVLRGSRLCQPVPLPLPETPQFRLTGFACLDNSG